MASTGSAARITPQVNEAEVKSFMSSSGWPPARRLNLRSHTRKPTSTATPTIIRVRAPMSPQPFWPASIRPYVRVTSPAADAAMPRMSMPGRFAARVSGTSAISAVRPSRATGTLMRKTQPHQNSVSIQPPRIGPIGKEMKLATAQNPTALGRSRALNSTVTALTAMTMIPAPAIPISTRAAMNSATDVESADPADSRAKSPSAISITLLRPKRSPRSPAGSIDAAITRK